MSHNTLINVGEATNMLDGVSGESVDSRVFATPAKATLLTFQSSFNIEPSSISLAVYGSMDGASWSLLATLTDVLGEAVNVTTALPLIKVSIASNPDDVDVSVNVIAKAYTIQNVTENVVGGLPLQVAADGDPVLLNAASDVVLSVSSGGFFQATENTSGHILELGDATLYTDAPMYVESSGLAASLTTYLGVPNADLTWTASSVGQAGNSLQIEYVDPGIPDQSISVTGTSTLTTINLATDSGSAITTTAQDIVDLGLGGSVTVALAPDNDGTGIVTALSPTNLSGGLVALNVTGPSSLDNGAITTNGSGGLTTLGVLSVHNEADVNILVVGGSAEANLQLGSSDAVVGPLFIATGGSTTDLSLDISAQGAGTINLNSPVVIANGATGTFTTVDLKTVTVTDGVITSIV